jgi:hypothetical protein
MEAPIVMKVRIFFDVFFILGYMVLGMLSGNKKEKRYDFCFGLIIAFVGLLLWEFGFKKNGMNIHFIPLEGMDILDSGYSDYWVSFYVFFLPFSFLYYHSTFIKTTPLLLLITPILPTIIIGIGIKLNRWLEVNSNKIIDDNT